MGNSRERGLAERLGVLGERNFRLFFAGYATSLFGAAANGLRGTASSTGQILGPSLAGIIVASGGAGWAIAIDSATYAVSAACLWRLAIPPRPASAPSSLVSQLAGGWHSPVSVATTGSGPSRSSPSATSSPGPSPPSSAPERRCSSPPPGPPPHAPPS